MLDQHPGRTIAQQLSEVNISKKKQIQEAGELFHLVGYNNRICQEKFERGH